MCVCALARISAQRVGVLLSPGTVFSGTFSVHRFPVPCCLPVRCTEQVITGGSSHGKGHPSLWVHPESSQGLRPPLRAPLPTFSSEFPPLDAFSFLRTFLKCVIQHRIWYSGGGPGIPVGKNWITLGKNGRCFLNLFIHLIIFLKKILFI